MTETMSDTTAFLEKVRSMLKDIRICMLTTEEAGGALKSRPMALQAADFDGDLWFFTAKDSHKSDVIQTHREVNVSASNPEDNSYVSMSGKGYLVYDPEKIKELWNPIYKAWFPGGIDDPQLVLLNVKVQQAEYWDSPSSVATYLVQLFNVATGGNPAVAGEHAEKQL